MGTVVLIPSYNPQDVLINLVKELHAGGIEVLVVNDGSGEEYKPIFDRVSEYAKVVGYGTNRGKGYALKTGIRYLAGKPDVTGFVTADGDGQHTVNDIFKIARILDREKAIVLGTRNLTKDIPKRSRIGNSMSKLTYTLVTGRYLNDNQSGLRGFTMDMADWLLKVKGNHYEYEMNVLVIAALKGCPMIEVPIHTIYENDNSSSHFKPLLDTARIQGGLLFAGLVPLIIYAACAAGTYCISRHKGSLAHGILWNGSLWMLHCLYRSAGFFNMRNKKAAAESIFRTFIRHFLSGATAFVIAVMAGGIVLGVFVPLAVVLPVAYLSGKFRGNRTGGEYESGCKRACP